MPSADAQERTRQETRSGVLEFEANGYPTDETVRRIKEEVDDDNDTRCMIVNPQGKTEVNSRQPLVKNADGSVRLVFSPQKPDGVPEANWIQTNPEKGFFAYFRWYSPTKAFFDRSWKMGNITEVK